MLKLITLPLTILLDALEVVMIGRAARRYMKTHDGRFMQDADPIEPPPVKRKPRARKPKPQPSLFSSPNPFQVGINYNNIPKPITDPAEAKRIAIKAGIITPKGNLRKMYK